MRLEKKLRTQGEKAAIIKELREDGFRLIDLLKAVGLAKYTYYFEIKKVDIVELRNEKIIDEIKDIFEKNKHRYGVRRVHKELVNSGHKVNHKRVQRLMNAMGLSWKHPCVVPKSIIYVSRILGTYHSLQTVSCKSFLRHQ